MKILQIGRAKSGNYWLWNILQELITATKLPNESFIQKHPIHEIARDWELSFKRQADIDVLDIEQSQCFYRISSIFRMPIQDLDSYLSKCNHVWTHSAYNEMSAEVLPKFDKIVLIIRDPRDVLISMAKFNQKNYMQTFFSTKRMSTDDYVKHNLPNFLNEWVKYNYTYLKNRDEYDIHVIFYEQLIHDFHETVRGLCDYLGVSLNADSIQFIFEKTHFTTLKQKDPDHVRQGKVYKWTNELNAQQQSDVVQRAGDFLATVGYPLDETDLDHIPDSKKIALSELDRAYQELTRVTLKERLKAGIIRRVSRF